MSTNTLFHVGTTNIVELFARVGRLSSPRLEQDKNLGGEHCDGDVVVLADGKLYAGPRGTIA